jgi:pyruvate dehydrogenase E1 component alpha subunit
MAQANEAPPAPTESDLARMLESMLLIRRTEERLGADARAAKIPGSVHLYIGQEAIATGVCAHLSDGDYITSTHRGHGHFLAKGGDLRRMVAEIYGRRTGICHGMGGSMHVADLSKGILGANGIVGAGIGIAAGAALAAQLAGAGAVAVAFFGDGAASQGLLSEVLNIGALWKLPVILVCEANGYSEFSASNAVTAGNVVERCRPFGIPGVAIDGNDLFSVWCAAGEAVSRARRGEGPSLIEARTYRIRGHVEAESGFLTEPYRSESEIDSWRARDPITRLRGRLEKCGLVTAAAFAAMEDHVARQVQEAAEFAEQSARPQLQDAIDSVFAGQAP